jgi:hypothetical protein
MTIIDFVVQKPSEFSFLAIYDLQGKIVNHVDLETGRIEVKKSGLYIIQGILNGKQSSLKISIP